MNLRDIRMEKRVLQAEMQELLGMSRPTYINFENRDNWDKLTLDQMLLLCWMFDLKPEDFIREVSIDFEALENLRTKWMEERKNKYGRGAGLK